MVLVTIIIVGVAGAMLGWNVHVMQKHGICCPPPSAEGTPGTSSRGVPEGKLRRRRHRSSGIRSREAETRRKARVVAGGGGASSRKVAIGPVQEHQEEARAPSSDAAVTAAVAVISTKGDDGPAQVGIPEA